MSTAAPSNPATLSKKERKALRKQMMERKEQLRAKHGRSGGDAGGGDSRLGSSRMFSDVKPKLPADPPKSKLPTWTPPAQPAPHRAVIDTPASKPAKSGGRRSLRPRVRDTYEPPAPAIIHHLDHAGPGPLTRAAAALESGLRHAAQLWRRRPWRDAGEPANPRVQTYRSLTLMIKPLRWLGIVAVGGAVVLGRESRDLGVSDTGSLVVLGMGLGLAVVLLALAEIAAGLRTIARRL